ncbi:MAG TPA: hypothetical protein DDY98_03845 [Ruminococcaceae bacterium]|nr:hypothetical protein [Oscillospiraceae bacterium]
MSKFLEDVKAFCLENNYCVYSIGEIKNGGEAEEITVIEANACQNGYSMAKAFTTTAIGLLYDRGKIKMQDKVVDLLKGDCPSYSDSRWEQVTVHHLLTHTAGLPGGCLDIDVLDSRTFGEDYLAYLFSLPFALDPGTERLYSDGAFYLLSVIAERITGENLLNFMWHELFFSLSVREAAWSCCPKGHCMGATGLYMRSDDTAKLGEIYRTGGVYQGTRYLSEEWVDLALSAPYELRRHDIGHLFGKGGMHGQNMFVDPDKKRVVAYHAYDAVDGEALMNFEYNYAEEEAE